MQLLAFDRDTALKRFGSREVLKEAIRAFLEESPRLTDRLEMHALAGNLDEMAAMAHCLKGSLAMLEACQSVEAAEDLRRWARQGNRAEAMAAWSRLVGAIALLREELRQAG
ncbi:MAG: Hpt domain-containing protein [Candidatus Eremiobacteraeota bacterium]|nr:Hpt domain-containing protein [Candidatus Eremiobacteraeota bacterium]